LVKKHKIEFKLGSIEKERFSRVSLFQTPATIPAITFFLIAFSKVSFKEFK